MISFNPSWISAEFKARVLNSACTTIASMIALRISFDKSGELENCSLVLFAACCCNTFDSARNHRSGLALEHEHWQHCQSWMLYSANPETLHFQSIAWIEARGPCLDRFSRRLLRTGLIGRNIESRKIGDSFFCVRSFCPIKKPAG